MENIEAFLSDPRLFRLKIEGFEYRIQKPLREAGDNPDFTSYLLERLVSTAPGNVAGGDKYVLKVMSPKQNGEGVKPDLNKIVAATAAKLKDAKRLERLAEHSVPAIHNWPGQKLNEALQICALRLSEPATNPGHNVASYVILREFIPGIILSRFTNRYEELCRTSRSFSGIRDVTAWFSLAKKIIAALIPVHNERRVHGDLRPRNIILEFLDRDLKASFDTAADAKDLTAVLCHPKTRVRLLDTEEDGPTWFPPNGIADTGTFRRRYDSPQRLFEKHSPAAPFRVRENHSQWFAPADIFSLGIILFSLACGHEAQLGPFLRDKRIDASHANGSGPTWFQVGAYQATKSNRQLKMELLRQWEETQHSRLGRGKGEISAEELNAGKEGIIRMSEVILACLRSHTDPSVADLKSIEAIIDEFEGSTRLRSSPCPPVDGTAQSTEDLIASLNSFVESRRIPDLIRTVIRRRGERLISPLADLERGNPHWSVTASGRPMMVDTIITLIRELRKDDLCQGLLTVNFFSKDNMGILGRLTSALQLAAIAGSKIEWVILVSEEQLKDRSVGEVLQAQRTAASYVSFCASRYGVTYVVVNESEYGHALQDHYTSIRIVQQDKNILVAPNYHGENGQISALRIWASPDNERWQDLADAFNKYKERELRLDSYYR